MDARIKAMLPDSVRQLADSIEISAGAEIKFRRGLRKDDPSPLAAQISERVEPVILYRDLGEISAESVLHELLHIERYLVEGEPQLYPKNSGVGGACEDIEDTLEHLVIVPREASYGFDPWEHEAQEAKRQWSRFDPSMAHLPQGRLGCMKTWLQVYFLVRDVEVREWVIRILRQNGIWALANRLATELEGKLDSKPAVASTFLRLLDIPSDGFRLLYFDVGNHDVRYEYVPEE